MDKRIVFTRPDGSVGVVIPAPRARGQVLVTPALRARVDVKKGGQFNHVEMVPGPDGALAPRRVTLTAAEDGAVDVLVAPAVFRDETDEEFLARVAAGAVPPDATDVVTVDKAEIPARGERRAWADERRAGRGRAP